MIDLHLIICAAVVVLSVSALVIAGAGAILPKIIDEETPEDQRPPVRYEYTARYVNKNPLCPGYRPMEKILNEMAADGWHVLKVESSEDSQYYHVYFERMKVEEEK